MLNRCLKNRLLGIALFATIAAVCAAQSAPNGGTAKAPAPKATAPAPKVDAPSTKAAAPTANVQSTKAAAAAKDRPKTGPGGTNLQALLRELNQTRNEVRTDHEKLAKQLKEATEQEKKAIKEKMESQMKAFEAQQAALHKQIRDEQRRQRQSAGSGKR